MRNRAILAAAVSMALCGSAAQAAPDLGDIFQFHAYGTADVVHSSQSEADFVSSSSQQTQGAGYTKSWSPDVDSKLAVQLNGHFTDKLSVVIQLISENDDNSTWTGKPNPRYRPSLEWANVKYFVTDDLSVRVGRMVLPFNLLSEFRNVGYSLPFVRAPAEMYGTIPFTNFDGGEVSYSHHFGGVINTFVAGVGVTTIRSVNLGASQAHINLVTDTVEVGALTLRADASYGTFKTPLGFGTLFDGFADAVAVIPGEGDAASTAEYLDSRYNTVHWGHIQTYGVGASYDPGRWFGMSELQRNYNTGLAGVSGSGFVAFGYRVQALTPYATYARIITGYPEHPSIPLIGLPPPLAAYGGTLNGILAGITSGNTSQQTLSAGLRWDFMKNLDLKVQYDYVRLDAGSTGLLVNEQPGFRPGSTASVFSAAVDFAF
jgi:opacity protein-like surface antigen